MSWTVTFKLSTDPPVFRIIRKLAAEAAKAEGLSHFESNEVEVAVGEALTGAYHEYGPGVPLELELEFDGLSLIITLHDNGGTSAGRPQGPDLTHGSPAARHLAPERRLHLIRHLVDDAEIVRADSMGRITGIRLRKKLL